MSVDWLKGVINNPDFKDDMVITLAGGQTVAIGDVRSLTKAQQKLLSDKETQLAAREAALQDNLNTLHAAQAETAKLFTELKGSKVEPPVTVVDPLEAIERDPVLGPLAKAIRESQNSYNDIRTKAIAPMNKALQDMASAYVSDRLEDQYQTIVPDAKKSSISLEAILKVANDNGLKTRTGIPDVRRAYQHMTTKPMTQDDIDSQLKAAREEGIKEGQEAARLRVPRPGIGAVGGRPESSFKPNIKDSTTVGSALGEALAAAAKDADIWANVDTSILQ